MEIIAMTDVGRIRELNEDAVGTLKFEPGAPNPWQLEALLLVADGMGGHDGGEVASGIAYETAWCLFSEGPPIESQDNREFLRLIEDAVQEINRAVHAHCAPSPEMENQAGHRAHPGTTLTLALLRRDEYFIGHVGDSRAYLIRPGSGKIEQITNDDSFIAEAVRRGHLSEADARNSPLRNQITKAIGLEAHVAPSVYYGHWAPNDVLLLCSDGLTEHVEAKEVAAAISGEADLAAACMKLVALANERGGQDNISIAAARNGDHKQEYVASGAKTLTDVKLTSGDVTAGTFGTSNGSALDNDVPPSATPSSYQSHFMPFDAMIGKPDASPSAGGNGYGGDEGNREEADQDETDGAARRKSRRARRNMLWAAGISTALGVILIAGAMGYRSARAKSSGRLNTDRREDSTLARQQTTASTGDTPSPRNVAINITPQSSTPTRLGAALKVTCRDGRYRIIAKKVDNDVENAVSGSEAYVKINNWRLFTRRTARDARGGARIEIQEVPPGPGGALSNGAPAGDDRARLETDLVPGNEYSLLYRSGLDTSKPAVREMARLRLEQRAGHRSGDEAKTTDSGGRDANG